MTGDQQPIADMQQPNLEFVGEQKKSGAKVAEYVSAPIKSDISVSSPSFAGYLLRLFDYIAVLRPLLLIPVWTMLLLGYHMSLSGNQSLPSVAGMNVIWRPDSRIILTLLLYSLLMGAIYILNQIFDSHTDDINSKLHLVARGYVKKRVLKIQIAILLLSSVILAILKFSNIYISLILLSIALGVLYSVPPIRLKGKPFLDLLANACGFGMVAFAVGWTCNSSFSVNIILRGLPYTMCIAAVFINTTIPDMKGDMQNGDKTTGIFLGVRRSCIISTALVATVPLIGFLLRDFICLAASALSLPLFIYMTILNRDEESPNFSAILLATKVSLLILSLLVTILVPFYFVLLVITLLMMKAYHKARFGVNYP